MSPRCPIFSTSWLSITCTSYPLPSDHVRQQRHLAGALYRRGGLPLVLRAEPRHPTGPHLAAVRDKTPQHVVVLVVHVRHVLLAEHARLALYRAPPAGRPTPSPTHSVPPRSVGLSWDLFGFWQRLVGVARRGLYDHVTQHVVGDAQGWLWLPKGKLAGCGIH